MKKKAIRRKKGIAAVILAAGLGTRMKSSKPKVLHTLLGRPMIDYSLETLSSSGLIDGIFVVVRNHRQISQFGLKKSIKTVLQKRPRGTGDAVSCAGDATRGFEYILVAYADTPLIFLEDTTLKRIIEPHLSKDGPSCTLLTATLDNPSLYGRIVRDRKRRVVRILEETSCSRKEKKIKEINAGLYCFRRKDLISALKEVTPSPPKKEYYLTDTIAILSRKGKKIKPISARNPREALGVNSPKELKRVEAILKKEEKNNE